MFVQVHEGFAVRKRRTSKTKTHGYLQ